MKLFAFKVTYEVGGAHRTVVVIADGHDEAYNKGRRELEARGLEPGWPVSAEPV